MKLEKFQEHVLFITVRIVSRNKSNGETSIGTGFIYTAFLDENKRDHITLLISNKHVFDDPNNSIKLDFHIADKTKTAPLLKETITIGSDDFLDNFIPHPNGIDLACINISKITDPTHNIFYKFINDSFIIPPSGFLDIMPGDEAWFVGYPQGRFDEVNNLPIIRRGYIASPPSIDFNGNKEFLIDANVFPGSSGSPLFTSLNGQFRFIGVISQVMIKNSRVQRIDSSMAEIGVTQEIGLGIVIKSECVTDLINHATKEINKLLYQAR